VFFSEVSASLYPWDLVDEGTERILDNLQEMTGCNSTYLIALMHHEKRPLTDYFYPHNPVRKTYFAEDSRAYFRPNPKVYGRIKPHTSDQTFLQGTDWLQVFTEASRRRNLKTGAELSHTVIDQERAAGELADCMQCDIFGNRLTAYICPNGLDGREYIIALFADLTSNYDVDYVQTCLLPFDSGRAGHVHGAARLLATTTGGCFCHSCEKAAADAGLDFAGIRSALLPIAESVARPSLAQGHELALLLGSNTSAVAMLLETPALAQWLTFRRDSLVRLYRDIHQRIHAIRPTVDLRWNDCWAANPELDGIDVRALKPHLDSIRVCDYTEQSGDMEAMEHKRQWLLAVRRAVGEEMHVLSALGVRPKATPALIWRGVQIAAECGMDGVTMGHYDGATFACLKAVKQGMEMAGVEIRPR